MLLAKRASSAFVGIERRVASIHPSAKCPPLPFIFIKRALTVLTAEYVTGRAFGRSLCRIDSKWYRRDVQGDLRKLATTLAPYGGWDVANARSSGMWSIRRA